MPAYAQQIQLKPPAQTQPQTDDQPHATAAVLQGLDKITARVSRFRTDANSAATKLVFSGWMFESSPAISALEDPVYDVNVLDCKMATAAAPSSPAAK